jgi:hypothetical protein
VQRAHRELAIDAYTALGKGYPATLQVDVRIDESRDQIFSASINDRRSREARRPLVHGKYATIPDLHGHADSRRRARTVQQGHIAHEQISGVGTADAAR